MPLYPDYYLEQYHYYTTVHFPKEMVDVMNNVYLHRMYVDMIYSAQNMRVEADSASL